MSKILRSSVLLAVPLMLVSGFVAHADEWTKRTKITVNQPIEVPGAVLPAGTYIFRLLDSPSNRNIVQVFNERMDHIYATIEAIPNYQMDVHGKTILTFYEVPAGQPQPVRAWFYPGDNYGQEFVYPKDRSLTVAQNSSTQTQSPVTNSETVEPQTAQAAPAQPQPEVAQNQTPEPAPAPEPVVEQPAPPQVAVIEPAPAPSNFNSQPVMPQTASNVPLVALAGLISIGAALGLSAFVKRTN